MKGILFRPEMIGAIISGSKTQTRRVIKPQPLGIGEMQLGNDGLWRLGVGGRYDLPRLNFSQGVWRSRYAIGEVVYIKEAFWEDSGDIYFKTDYPTMPTNMFLKKGKWKSPLFLPEMFAQYFIKITDVGAERLQEITEEDAIKEGMERQPFSSCELCRRGLCSIHQPVLGQFHNLWNSINKPPYDWDSNLRVWVYTFKRERGYSYL